MIIKLKQFLIAILVLLTGLSFSSQASAAQNFSDVSSSADGYEEIQYIFNKEIIKGYTVNGSTYYRPFEILKRSQAAKMLVVASGEKPLIVSKSSFKDVKVGTEESGYIERAVQLGYLTGNSDGTFDTYKNLTRDDMSIALVKAFKLNIVEHASKDIVFSDVSNSGTLAKYVKAIYYNGITQGSGNKYMPTNGVNRKQFAQFVARGMEDKFKVNKEVGGVTLPDLNQSIGQVIVTVKNDSLNVRTEPNTSSSIVGQVVNGDKLYVYEKNGNWLKVDYKGELNYISSAYTSFLDANGNAIVAESAATNVSGKVTAASLNVRSGPGDSYSNLGKLPKNTMVAVKSINGSWAKIIYAGGEGYVNKLYLKLLNQSGSVLNNRIILIDAGHGGKDPGASSKGVTEKSVVIKVAKLVEQKLKNSGASVVMTRAGDSYPTLQNRVALAKSTNSEIFVSIHVNAIGSSSVTGTETFYNLSLNDNGAESKVLATKIQSEIIKNADMYSRGVKPADYYVNRMVDMPSVLVELGFITNQKDFNKLVDDKYVEIYAQSIYNGIRDYYSVK